MRDRPRVARGSLTERAGHAPVLRAEMLAALEPRADALYVDGTFGGGGYSRALLEAGVGRLIALDRDPQAIAGGRELARQWPALTLVEGRFGELERHLDALGIGEVDGIVLDLGVSSMQLDQPERGFSFSADGPLDMRMGGQGPSAADLVAEADEATLADLIFRLGEEPAARRVARAIVRRRRLAPLRTTAELADLVAATVPRGGGRIHPATRTFQALRIAVNDELGELERALAAAERRLAPGGRLVVVAFHSLEDRMVKQFLAERSGSRPTSRHRPDLPAPPATFRLLTRRPLRPGPDEVARNPRARSARLRAAERVAGAAA
jgi:16S rRNA (cytosine1402-N4)-methyltransferase